MYGCRENVSGLIYGRWDDGRPYSLVDAWRDVEGVAGMSIVCLATGRVVLSRAGESVGRRYAVRRMYAERVTHRNG